MKRVLALSLVIYARAHASPIGVSPIGWTSEPERAAELARVGHFGMQHAETEAEVFMPPGTSPGVELIVTRATAMIGAGDRSAAARAEVDELHAMSRRATLMGSGVGEDNWQARVDAVAHQIEADLSWRDGSAKLVETARLVIAGDAKRLAATTGECIARDDADAALIAACKTALATLDPGIDPKARVDLVLAPEGTPVTPAAIEPPSPQMTAGSHTPLPPITVPQDAPPADRRPMIVGAGLLVLAGVLWWNTRRRRQYEREAQESSK